MEIAVIILFVVALFIIENKSRINNHMLQEENDQLKCENRDLIVKNELLKHEADKHKQSSWQWKLKYEQSEGRK